MAGFRLSRNIHHLVFLDATAQNLALIYLVPTLILAPVHRSYKRCVRNHHQIGGGLLAINVPNTANSSDSFASSSSSSSPSGRKKRQGGTDNAILGEEGFQPFVQLASWGHGSFNPLAQFSSGLLLLGGGGGGVGDGAGAGSWGAPSAAGASAVEAAATVAAATRMNARMENNGTNYDRTHAIRTRHGGLEIAPAGGEAFVQCK